MTRRFLLCEGLETRSLPSGTPLGEMALGTEAPIDDTLDRARDLGVLEPGARAVIPARLGDSPAGAADVDWFAFQLHQTTRVRLGVQPAGSEAALPAILSLYNTDSFDGEDLFAIISHRLLQRHEAVGAQVDAWLGAGTYHVAVSGAGNRVFHPFLADSGLPGATGPYTLSIVTEESSSPDNGAPRVLATEPAAEADLDRSPLVLRVALSAALDPGTVSLDDNVQLLRSETAEFQESSLVSLSSFRLAPSINELQLRLSAPLSQGFYRLFLRGAPSEGLALLGLDGQALGTTEEHPLGDNLLVPFRVSGNESRGRDVADDTPENSQDLGILRTDALTLVDGALGDDATDPTPFNIGDVDLYHFRISGDGLFAFSAEVFGGRLGAPTDTGLTLYRGDERGELTFVASNSNSGNLTLNSLGGARPLFSDPALFQALSAGDYYLAVSGEQNVPDFRPDAPRLPGVDGIFDPRISHSGQIGVTVGPYTLSLRLQSPGAAPQVTSTTPAQGANLDAPPAQLQVVFAHPVNLRSLAGDAALQGRHAGQIAAIYLEGEDGTRYLPRLIDYDLESGRANFVLLEPLPTGNYSWHLSGSLGLTGFDGTPLQGNEDSGDYVIDFHVSAAPRGSAENPRHWNSGDSTPDEPVFIGRLFPIELEGEGVSLIREDSPNATGTNVYEIEVTQSRGYFFLLSGKTLGEEALLSVLDADGVERTSSVANSQDGTIVELSPGSYRLVVRGLAVTGTPYTIRLGLATSEETPLPLVVGANPATRLRLVSAPPTAGSPSPTAPSLAPPTPVVVGPHRNSDISTPRAGVVEASTRTVSAPLRTAAPSSSSGLSPTTTLPSSGLVVQTVSPISGVTGAGVGDVGNTSGDRVVIRSGAAPVAEAFWQTLIVTTQASTDETESPDDAYDEEPSIPDPRVQNGMPPWTLDLFFGLWEAVRGAMSATPEPTTTEDSQESILRPQHDVQDHEEFPELILACAVAGLVVPFQAPDQGRPNQRRLPRALSER